ncbi:MAG: M3 family oligoendopeptidase [Lachnospiraceae bacterium]|nr:M3 family oligoendopeptidase [Lachnospiraceae bacterium]
MQKFADMEYKRPDVEAFRKYLNDYIENLKAAPDYETAKKLFLAQKEKMAELSTMRSIAYIRNTVNTADEFYDGEITYFNSEMPKLSLIMRKASEALLDSPFRADFEKDYGTIFIKNMENSRRFADERIIPDQIEEGKLEKEYSRTSASCKTTFRGKECNFYGLLKAMQSTDRAERKEAFEAWADLYERTADELDREYDELIEVRCRIAHTLGFSNYIDMAYLSRRRFDYTAEDVKVFRKQVKDVIVPAVDRLFKEQAERLGVDKLRYYDESLCYPDGNAVPIGNKDELVAKAQKMYHELSPETAEFFDFMVENDLFDLETKPGKRPGGYCTSLPMYKAPFIFSNFNGTSADVDVLTHEAGHAFEGYTASRVLPISDLSHSTSEINEIHSMAMEHFTYPWMELFFGENADKYRYAHLKSALEVIPYMVCVDEFQHRVFENGGLNAKERRAVWHELEQTYMPWRDYDGNEFLGEGGFWMQKQHIFLYPFYYIDYALAQMGAFEFYTRMKQDHAAAWADYYKLCTLGGSKGYFELLESVGLSNPFKEGSVRKAVSGVLEELFKENKR